MSRTVIDIDDDALEVAMAELGTTTKVDTVNKALREVARYRAERRSKALDVFDRIASNLDGFDRGEAWRGSA